MTDIFKSADYAALKEKLSAALPFDSWSDCWACVCDLNGKELSERLFAKWQIQKIGDEAKFSLDRELKFSPMLIETTECVVKIFAEQSGGSEIAWFGIHGWVSPSEIIHFGKMDLT